jgi:hypothetical protein
LWNRVEGQIEAAVKADAKLAQAKRRGQDPRGVAGNSVRLNFCMAVALSDASGQYGRSIQLPWPSH